MCRKDGGSKKQHSGPLVIDGSVVRCCYVSEVAVRWESEVRATSLCTVIVTAYFDFATISRLHERSLAFLMSERSLVLWRDRVRSVGASLGCNLWECCELG